MLPVGGDRSSRDTGEFNLIGNAVIERSRLIYPITIKIDRFAIQLKSTAIQTQGFVHFKTPRVNRSVQCAIGERQITVNGQIGSKGKAGRSRLGIDNKVMEGSSPGSND